jgi:hypothetical protein
VRNVHLESKFFEALSSMATERSEFYAYKRNEKRAIITALTTLSIASLFTLEFSFDNWGGVNILPHFIYGLFLLCSVYLLDKCVKTNLITYLAGICYVSTSTIAYICSVLFLSKYEYLDIIDTKAAQNSYLLVEIFGVIEFVFLVVFLVLITFSLNRFILTHTGIPPSDEKYGSLDSEFHKSLKIKNGILCGLGIFAALTKCLNLFLNGNAQVIFTSTNAVTTSSIPWFNLVVQLASIAYIFFSFYFISTLKDEIKNRYSN